MSVKRLAVISLSAAVAAVAIRVFAFGFYVVPSSSMVPTLLTGDFIVASKYAYGYGSLGTFGGLVPFAGRIGGHAPQRGDVVVFRSTSAEGPPILVKRLIGLPGDHIRMVRDHLYINGAPVRQDYVPETLAFPGDDEPTDAYSDYIEYLPDGPAHPIRLLREFENEPEIDNTPDIVVPPGHYFFMGDNRDHSDDSRASALGFVPEGNIAARADMTFLSYSRHARLTEVSKWPWAMRWHRLFAPIR